MDSNEEEKESSNMNFKNISYEVDSETLILNKAPIKRHLKPESKTKRIRIRLPIPTEPPDQQIAEIKSISQQIVKPKEPELNVPVETLREFSRREQTIDRDAHNTEVNISLRKGPPFTCKLCSVWFLVKTKLAVHYVTNHKAEYCGLCNIVFPNVIERVDHENRIHFPIECEICMQLFKDNWVLNEHYETDHDVISCLFCGILVQPKSCYVTHIRRKHNVYDRYFDLEDGLKICDEWDSQWHWRCRLCNKSRNKKDFVGHYNMHHKVTIASLVQLIASENLELDIIGNRDDDTEEAKILKDLIGTSLISKNEKLTNKCCNICNMSNNNNVPALFHQVYCHSHFGCKNCLKIFMDKKSLNAHIEKIHRYFQCVLGCAKVTCASEKEINEHYNASHDIVTCQFCNIFVNKSDDKYTEHLKTQHMFNIDENKLDSKESLFYLQSEKSIFCCLCDINITDIMNDVETLYLHFSETHNLTIKSILSLIKSNPLQRKRAKKKIKRLDNCSSDIFCDDSCSSVNDSCSGTDSDEEQNNVNDIIPKISIKKEKIEEDEKYDPIIAGEGIEDIDPTEVECYMGETSDDELIESSIENEEQEDKIIIKSEPVDYEDIDVQNTDGIKRKSQLKCDICKCSIPSQKDLLSHAHLTHGFIIKVSLLTCEECPETFTTEDNLEMHMINAHGKELNRSKEKISCPFCEYKNTKTALRVHIITAHKTEIENAEPSVKLGYKCRFCCDLFWQAVGRNDHEIEQHSKQFGGGFYKCFVCFKIYSSRLCLKRHVHSTHKLEPKYSKKHLSYKCLKCHVLMPRLDEIRNHFNQMHPNLKIFRCDYTGCNARLKSKKTYYMHVKHIHEVIKFGKVVFDGPSSCKLCGRWLSTPRAASAHYRMKHIPEKRVGFKCRLCPMRFESNEKRKLHYATDHRGEGAYTCAECGKGFSSKSGLYGHKQLHMNSSYECQYCHKSFARRDTYTEHLLIHSGPRHQCPYCPRIFTQRSNLTRHKRIHTGDKPYSCTMCPKRFSDKGACNSHMRVHTREEESACPYCGKVFSKKQKLNYHIRKHTGEGLVSCPTCSKVFTNSFSLKEHCATHETGTQVLCGECGRGFSHERYLKRHHVAMHTQHGRKHECSVCGKRFVAANQLKSHVMTHADVKHIKCLLCNTSFSSRKTIARHLLRKHQVSINADSEDSLNKYFYEMSTEEAGLHVPDKDANFDEESPTMVPIQNTIDEVEKIIENKLNDTENKEKVPLNLSPKKVIKKRRRSSFKVDDFYEEEFEVLPLETKSRKIKKPQRYVADLSATNKKLLRGRQDDCFETSDEIEIKNELVDEIEKNEDL